MVEMVAAGIKFEEGWVMNAGSMKLSTCTWLPANHDIKALVFLCHGYGVECSVFMKGTGERLAEAGYAVFGIDYQGHGKSAGMRCFIDSFEKLVQDARAYFDTVREREEYRDKARFLLGESMGGAVALCIHLNSQPGDWNGGILQAPMFKISEEIQPTKIVANILACLEPLIPTWKIVPTKDIIDEGFKEPAKRKEIRDNPLLYKDRVRLKTALEMLRATQRLNGRLDEVTFPFLLLHGEADKVTDIEVSQELYQRAASCDKTFKRYPEMWHGLTTGEPDHNIDRVFTDVILWLNERSWTADSPSTRSALIHSTSSGMKNSSLPFAGCMESDLVSWAPSVRD